MATVSLCMIVKNEAADLPACLESARPVVDEMVVVDTGSSDETAKVAERFSAQVSRFAWCDDFSAARNASLERAHGDWILVLDADETLDAPSQAQLRSLLNGSHEAVWAMQRNLSPPGELLAHIDLPVVRLFRNRPNHRYEGVIHEQIQPAIERAGGSIARSSLVIVHSGYQRKLAQGSSRAQRNLALLQSMVASRPDDAYLHYQLGVTQKAVGEARAAYASLERAATLAQHGANFGLGGLHMKLAQLALQFDDYARAVQFAERCLFFEPENPIAHHVQGMALLFLGRHQEAANALSRAANNPTVADGPRADLRRLIDHLRGASPA